MAIVSPLAVMFDHFKLSMLLPLAVQLLAKILIPYMAPVEPVRSKFLMMLLLVFTVPAAVVVLLIIKLVSPVPDMGKPVIPSIVLLLMFNVVGIDALRIPL